MPFTGTRDTDDSRKVKIEDTKKPSTNEVDDLNKDILEKIKQQRNEDIPKLVDALHPEREKGPTLQSSINMRRLEYFAQAKEKAYMKLVLLRLLKGNWILREEPMMAKIVFELEQVKPDIELPLEEKQVGNYSTFYRIKSEYKELLDEVLQKYQTATSEFVNLVIK